MILIGEPFWLRLPPTQEAVEACHAGRVDDYRPLDGLIEEFGTLGYDVVEMMLADRDSYDRYRAAQWLNVRRWLDQNPDDELAPAMRDELTSAPVRYVRYEREYLGWGVFAIVRN